MSTTKPISLFLWLLKYNYDCGVCTGFKICIELTPKIQGVVAIIRDEKISTRHPGMWTICSPRLVRTGIFKQDSIVNMTLLGMVLTICWLDNRLKRCGVAAGHVAVNTSTHRPGRKAIGSPQVERTDNEVIKK